MLVTFNEAEKIVSFVVHTLKIMDNKPLFIYLVFAGKYDFLFLTAAHLSRQDMRLIKISSSLGYDGKKEKEEMKLEGIH